MFTMDFSCRRIDLRERALCVVRWRSNNTCGTNDILSTSSHLTTIGLTFVLDGVTNEQEGEDIMDMDRIDADYVAIPELDTYDDADLDRREYGTMDFSDRRAAEKELTERYTQGQGCIGLCSCVIVLFARTSMQAQTVE